MKIILASFLLLFLGSCASTQVENNGSPDFTQVPDELAAVDWSRSPRDTLVNPKEDEPVVWVGVVKEVLVYKNAANVEIDWLCQYLRFVQSGPAAISKRPIAVRKGTGLFGVSLVVENMSLDEAKKFQIDHTHIPHYVLVGGRLAAVQDWKGDKIPFVKALRMSLGPKLVDLAE